MDLFVLNMKKVKKKKCNTSERKRKNTINQMLIICFSEMEEKKEGKIKKDIKEVCVCIYI